MVRVETLEPHGNPYGDSYDKKKGDQYELPATLAETLAADKLVKRIKR